MKEVDTYLPQGVVLLKQNESGLAWLHLANSEVSYGFYDGVAAEEN